MRVASLINGLRSPAQSETPVGIPANEPGRRFANFSDAAGCADKSHVELTSDNVRFAGYAALFDRIDCGSDIIRHGAFRRALQRQSTWPLLWQHQQDQVIGQVSYAAQDRRGLRIIAQMSTSGTQANNISDRAKAMLRNGAVTGLSFGYRVRNFSEVMAGHITRRELLALDLIEVSLVTHPMQPAAKVHMIEFQN